MVYARYEGTAVDEAGNVLANCTVEVREDRAGRPVVPLFSDRQGTVPMGNPIQTDGQGRFAFHARGGVYWVRVYQGPSQEPTRQFIRRYQALGTAAERDVEDLASALEAGTATFPTLAELEAFVPTDPGVGGKVTAGADAGFYHYDDVAEEWVFDRRLYDSLAQLVVTGGTDDDIEAAVDAAIAEAAVQMLWIEAPGDNTGPVTINGKEVLTASGNSLLEGQWFEGRTYWLTDEGATYKLRTESDVAGIATQVETAANTAIDHAGYAEEWAQSDSPISVDAGGDGATDRSSKWHADRAEDASDVALGAVPNVYSPTRASLKALDTDTITHAYLTEPGREGQFIWRTGDYSSDVAADTEEGVYLEADDVAATSGAWVRVLSVPAPELSLFGGDHEARDAYVASLDSAVALDWGPYPGMPGVDSPARYGRSFSNGNLTGTDIYNRIDYNSVAYEELAVVVDVPAGSDVPHISAVGGYMRVAAEVNGIMLFGVGTADANNARLWGVNTLLQDAPYRNDSPWLAGATQTALTGVYLVNELDFNIQNTDTIVIGLGFGGASLVRPKSANALAISGLAPDIPWYNGLVGFDGAADFILNAGSAVRLGSDIASQKMRLGHNVGGVRRNADIYSSGGALIIEGSDGFGLGLKINNQGSIFLDGGAAVHIAGLPVVKTPEGGWVAPTGTAYKLGFATETASTVEVARVVKAVVDLLMYHGLAV